MHWADRVAERLLKRGEIHTIASGISISGHIHIGHSKDVFIADAVRRALEDLGGEARVIAYSDDFDPMRRVPWPLSEDEYQRHLGVPYFDIPSPDPEFENFVEFFERPFLESLEEFGIRPEIYSSTEVYKRGLLAKQIRTAFEKSDEIRKILNQYRREPLPEDWLPFEAVCEKCRKIATTRSYGWNGRHVLYMCEGAEYVEGCSHEGKADFTKGEGKLTWRVEWPARWEMLGVTCEPFGKDHAAAGGSYDTGKPIARQVFDCEPPEPIPYEWISFKGKPMSSSKGRVFTLPQWLEVGEPELLRYFIFRSKALKAKDFDPGFPLLDLYKEYRRLEKAHFRNVSKGKREKLDRIYELSQVIDTPPQCPQRIPFRLATVMIQVARNENHVIEILCRKGVLEHPEDWEIELAKKRLMKAKNWVENYVPAEERIKILKELPERVKKDLLLEQKECLSSLADDLSERNYSPVEIHNRIYETARSHNMEPVDLFQAIYKVLLGRKSGPRVGNFLTALEDNFVVKRFREAANNRN